MKKALLILQCMILTASIAQATKHTIAMTDQDRFSPATLTISKGDTVVWMNNDTDQHTTTSGSDCTPSDLWDSGPLDAGATFSRQFTTAGRFDYHCSFHCDQGMVGTITVNDVQVSGTKSPSYTGMQITAFPNPFAHTTTVQTDLTSAGRVKVEVSDSHGNIVYTAPETFVSPGEQNFTIRGDFLREGIYFCRILLNDLPVAEKAIVKY